MYIAYMYVYKHRKGSENELKEGIRNNIYGPIKLPLLGPLEMDQYNLLITEYIPLYIGEQISI